MKNKTNFLFILILPLLVLIPFSNNFPFPINSNYSDLTISHYPNAVFIRESIKEYGQIPLWSDAILSGYPFSANPLSGLWYPPGWLALLIPLPFAFNLLIIIHLFFGGIGLYKFLQLEGYHDFACLIGALTFEAMPKLFAHYAAGHITLVFAVAWMPWLLYTSKKVLSKTNGFQYFPGIILGIIILADVRWSLFSGFLLLCYLVKIVNDPKNPQKSIIHSNLHGIIFLAKNVVIALLISAPLLLPFVQYVLLSSRVLLQSSDNLTLSLPPLYLFGFIFPNLGGYAEWQVYQGAYSIIALVWCLSIRELRKKNLFWLIILTFGIFTALGSAIPGSAQIITKIPLLNFLRVPARMIFISSFAFSMITAAVTDQFCGVSGSTPFPRRPVFFITILTFFALTLAAGMMVINTQILREFLLGGSMIFIMYLVLILRLRGTLSRSMWSVLLFIAILMDYGIVNASQIKYIPSKEILSQGILVTEYLLGKAKPFRTYSPSYSIQQHTASLNHFELADGIDPLQLISYVDYMEEATGVPNSGYSVTLPPFSSGNPIEDNRVYAPNLEKLAWLNVKYIVSEYPMAKVKGLIFEKILGSTIIYSNELAYPRAWVQKGSSSLYDPGSILTISILPNSIHIQAEGPGVLVISEVDYPGWQVVVDGKIEKILTIKGLLRGVSLSSGRHEISFKYRPILVYIGIWISCALQMGLLYLFLKKVVNEKNIIT